MEAAAKLFLPPSRGLRLHMFGPHSRARSVEEIFYSCLATTLRNSSYTVEGDGDGDGSGTALEGVICTPRCIRTLSISDLSSETSMFEGSCSASPQGRPERKETDEFYPSGYSTPRSRSWRRMTRPACCSSWLATRSCLLRRWPRRCKLYTPNPRPSTLNPQPSTLNPKP